MRSVCLKDVPLLSDRQPEKLRVDNHGSGWPAIWLHDEFPQMAWILVDIGPRDWCKLAYQFGHELGHVLCNSWRRDAKPRLPCQWLEEALVEAFSIRGLGLLAESWGQDPPFAGDAGFANSIKDYRQHVIDTYRAGGTVESDDGMAAWFRANRGALEDKGGVRPAEGPVILRLVSEYAADRASVADLGALNRWSGRSGVPLEEYLSRWRTSCAEIAAPGRLPERLGSLLNVG